MATTRYETAAQIVKDAAVPLGLEEISDPFSSTDPAQVRLCRCLTLAGRELVQIHRWQHLQKACDITAALGDGRAWMLPADFAGIVANTFWNQTHDEFIAGPISAAEWNDYEATGTTPFSTSFRMVQDTIAVIPATNVTDGDALQYEYHGKSWVTPSGGSLSEDRATLATDTVHFDPSLMGIALRRQWMISNGMDTASIESQYTRAVERLKGIETPGRAASIIPRDSAPHIPNFRDRSWTL